MKKMHEKLRLLFVSNDSNLKSHIECCLDEYPCTKTYSSYTDGLSVLSSFSPQIVFMDFSNPLENSRSFLEEAKKKINTASLSFIIITGIEEKIRAEAIIIGKPNDFIRKPFLKEELIMRIEINRKMTEQQSRTEECERLRSLVRMSRKTGHDINNPLTTVIGNSDMLLEEKLDESHMKMISMIRRESLKIATLVDELMVSSDMEQGK